MEKREAKALDRQRAIGHMNGPIARKTSIPVAKQEPQYDVFISYRRGEIANKLARLLQQALKHQGLSAFLDRDLTSGTFDDKFLRLIAESRCFLLILTPGALDRCGDEQDWVRKEIVQAISCNRNIIPLADSFEFTETVKSLGPAIRELSRHQAIPYSDDFFESTVARIVERIKEAPVPAGTVKINANDGQKYIWIPAGAFLMGSAPDNSRCCDDERPEHRVTISKGFWIGQTPVTQSAYRKVLGHNSSRFQGEQLPMENVTWYEAKTYCIAVRGRLPTEAEWEYAARAGTTTARYGDLDEIAWHKKNSGYKTCAVAQKQPNQWGLYDMLGNVWEWVVDWYDDKYYQVSPPKDPTGPASGTARVARGGSWIYDPEDVRFSSRLRIEPLLRVNNVGFRCVLEAGP